MGKGLGFRHVAQRKTHLVVDVEGSKGNKGIAITRERERDLNKDLNKGIAITRERERDLVVDVEGSKGNEGTTLLVTPAVLVREYCATLPHVCV